MSPAERAVLSAGPTSSSSALRIFSSVHPWPLELCAAHNRSSLNASKMTGGDDGAGIQLPVLKRVGPSSSSAKKMQLLQVGKMPGAPCVALGMVPGGAIWPDQDDPAVLGGQGRGTSPHPQACPSGIHFGHPQAPALRHAPFHQPLGPGQPAGVPDLALPKERAAAEHSLGPPMLTAL